MRRRFWISSWQLMTAVRRQRCEPLCSRRCSFSPHGWRGERISSPSTCNVCWKGTSTRSWRHLLRCITRSQTKRWTPLPTRHEACLSIWCYLFIRRTVLMAWHCGGWDALARSRSTVCAPGAPLRDTSYGWPPRILKRIASSHLCSQTRIGRPLSKHWMIQMIRRVSQECGVSTTRSDGTSPPKQLFGGHCLRVSGAQFLSASGVSTARSVVQQCSGEIYPSCSTCPGARTTRADSDRGATSIMDWSVLFVGRFARTTRTTLYISDPVQMGFDPQLMEEDMKRLASQLADVRSMIETPSDNLVVRPRQNVVHLGTKFERINNPQMWRTKCGWNYGVSRFFRIPHMSDEFRQCRKSFDHGEAQQEASSDSDSQSDESSGSESSEPSEWSVSKISPVSRWRPCSLVTCVI